MEILYLYFVSEEVPFNNQDINFGGEYRFHYNNKLKSLQVSKNQFYIKDFFNIESDEKGLANVLNVTSVIGENGTGKSTLLKLLKDLFAEGSGGISKQLIIALKNKDGVFVYHFDDVQIEFDNLIENGIQKKMINFKKEKLITFSPRIDEFIDVDFIYFSNIFDGGNSEMQVNGIKDISTNYLVKYDSVNDSLNYVIPQNKRELETFFFNDIERQIAFINFFTDKTTIPFGLPENIFISFKSDILNKVISENESKILDEYGIIEDFKILKEQIITKLLLKNEDGSLSDYFISGILLNFIYEIAQNYRSITQYVKLNINIINTDSFKNKSVKEIAIRIINEIENQSKNSSIQMPEGFHNTINGSKDFIEIISKANFINKTNSVTNNDISVNITRENYENFKSFYKSYRRSYDLRPYLNFQWRSLSSGENALLNIYARFYSLSNEEVVNELKSDIIILIDEGDVLLHPSWQKQFLFLLLNYLPKVFGKTRSGTNRNIQIILTTNSPIPASDLPNDNTIFLEKVNLNQDQNYYSKTIIKDSLNDQKQTFAGNIYTLLTDSFFIKNGLIGDFATFKLNEIIKELARGEKPDFNRREEIRKIILQIGEPVIKNKLMQLYNERFNLEIHERLDIIEKKLGI